MIQWYESSKPHLKISSTSLLAIVGNLKLGAWGMGMVRQPLLPSSSFLPSKEVYLRGYPAARVIRSNIHVQCVTLAPWKGAIHKFPRR